MYPIFQYHAHPIIDAVTQMTNPFTNQLCIAVLFMAFWFLSKESSFINSKSKLLPNIRYSLWIRCQWLLVQRHYCLNIMHRRSVSPIWYQSWSVIKRTSKSNFSGALLRFIDIIVPSFLTQRDTQSKFGVITLKFKQSYQGATNSPLHN